MLTVSTDGSTPCNTAFQAAIDLAASTKDWISLGSTPYVLSAPGLVLRANTIIEGLPNVTTVKATGGSWAGSAMTYNGSTDQAHNLVWSSGPSGFCEGATGTTNAVNDQEAAQFASGDWCLVQSVSHDGSLSWSQHSQLYNVTPPWLNWQNPINIPLTNDCSIRTASKFNPIKNIAICGITFDMGAASGSQTSAISGNYSQDLCLQDIVVLHPQNAGVAGWGDLRPRYKNIRVSNGGTNGDASHYFWKQTDGQYDDFVSEAPVFGPTLIQCNGANGSRWKSYRSSGRNIKFSGLMYSNFSDINTHFGQDTGLSIQAGCGVLAIKNVSAMANGAYGPPGDQNGVTLQGTGCRFVTLEDVHSVGNLGYDLAVAAGNSDTLLLNCVYGAGSKFFDGGTRTLNINPRTVPM